MRGSLPLRRRMQSGWEGVRSAAGRPAGGLPAFAAEGQEQGERELRRARRSFAAFLLKFVWLRDGGGTRLEPWPWQVELALCLPRHRRVILLKARQLGLSWIAAAYALWTALFQPGALVLLVSQTEDDALELLDKARFIFDHLPGALRPEAWKGSTRVLKFPESHSAVVALPSTRRAGRGKTARLVIADEHAYHQFAEENFAALQPTMDAGGQFWIVSTAAGSGNPFAEIWAKAARSHPVVAPTREEGRSPRLGRALRRARPNEEGWLPVFLPYDARPGRDAAWWERKRESYLRAWMIHQEYPRDPDEAFVQTGRPRFQKEYLDKHRELCREPLPSTAWPSALRISDFGLRNGVPALRVFDLPQPGHRYFAGVDVAEGLEHGDYSDLSVFDADPEPGGPRAGARERPVEVLSLHGHWEPDEFARLLCVVAKLYPGLYGIERNNHGLATVLACRRLGMRGLYAERPVLNAAGREVEPGKPGWLTTSVTKPLMIDGLEEALRTFGVRLSDAAAIPELVFYQTQKDGSTGAPSGQWDDRVMSRAIAVQMRKFLPVRQVASEEEVGVGTLAPLRW